MILQASCDKCGNTISGEEIFHDDDGQDLCRVCLLKEEIEYLKDTYAARERWIKQVHYNKQFDLLARIEELEQQIKEGNETHRNITRHSHACRLRHTDKGD